MQGHENNGFQADSPSIPGQFRWSTVIENGVMVDGPKQRRNSRGTDSVTNNSSTTTLDLRGTEPDGESAEGSPGRDQWGKGIEFLMSCIAMSVGLGNVWRFPFIALENGGGAFVIPYIIVLLLVGKPVYYMEMIIGQFSSRGSVKVYDCVPALRGIGYGQVLSIAIVSTYYASLMATTLKYLFESFQKILPWATCDERWAGFCIPSGGAGASAGDALNSTITAAALSASNATSAVMSSSAELYYRRVVLKELDNIDDGIGLPDWQLTLFLCLSWSIVLLVLIRGVKSAGKASYFLALFPYLVITILLVRACTLPGAINGIIYFLKPQWDKILDPKVWYAAVTQCFFSLSICFGNIIMYSSYNKFRHNVHRDATIVTTIDTFTSLLAGCTIFGILGHLAHVVGSDDVGSVVKPGAGLAFISYPEAIAKFDVVPQAFSVLFFLMLFVLGIGSNVAMTSCVMTVIRDQFPKVKNWQAATVIAICGVALGCIYVTPGGQYILTLVDHFGASFIALVLAIAELIAIGWIYGVDRLCKDVEFMLGHRPNLYWRLCWRWVTPLLMTAILIYNLVTLQPLTYQGYVYPTIAYDLGWCIAALGLLQLPIWGIYAIYKQEGKTLSEKVMNAFRPTRNWGPIDPTLNQEYKKFIHQE
ncbi:sodium-dependent nutrient amino acid transporter 1 isoform X1 [Culex quinquefasciatus]|uniref:sodium-dependent nutrient amino acid transporter 1 isoform X1 n=1 Tax=Culex quinquefasciatus TaxID=7176 RepID=UPI0018E2D674|nr:sodium-dependent nutrient amino acid transporter 1 isoform X1 [Culex quinquefasciatus]XP_038109009.1 sodium-dependent nutrient amino acid transporter 1 isoform X1 [Culex quinquefasciatus]XP_038109010.1 sodium-dependent nutrient amino acid transporter 1 isoform X1 [Culex quinquefasciatus]XP_038109011.1 sodium-dependent nutrient amino acid transporter 1 isoform X1 [Culex quinquefasciatus]XP_038109013.1 sodium-dependent nutrient amino acid transporter 1 isoform X1 [Culex quinquefasciatus]